MGPEGVKDVFPMGVAPGDAVRANYVFVVRMCVNSNPGINVCAHYNVRIWLDGTGEQVHDSMEGLVLCIVAGKICRYEGNRERTALDLLPWVSKGSSLTLSWMKRPKKSVSESVVIGGGEPASFQAL